MTEGKRPLLRYRLARPALALVKARRLLAGSPPGFRVLLFHDVPPRQQRSFETLVEYIERVHGILSPDEAAGWLEEGRAGAPGRTPCLFSFDDGFASNFTFAREILARHRAKALFFVCPGLMDLPAAEQPGAIARHIFDDRLGPGSLAPGLRLMTWEEVAGLRAEGHTIGAHGMTHARLSRLRNEALAEEVGKAGMRLEQRLGEKPAWYAFAFGTMESVTPEALAVIGAHYRFCRSGVRGPNRNGTPRLAIRADQIDLDAPFTYQRLVLEGGLDGRYRGARRTLDAMAGN